MGMHICLTCPARTLLQRACVHFWVGIDWRGRFATGLGELDGRALQAPSEKKCQNEEKGGGGVERGQVSPVWSQVTGKSELIGLSSSRLPFSQGLSLSLPSAVFIMVFRASERELAAGRFHRA
ncbi:hypothetical protein HJG60_009353 [Phyllostomus discolor]|uniref:Uncharacterized protein n=1 Tax=Phyllostomus discolor TaxID=89673 RepID=A0A833Y8V1_9CHIR|nr:hypothetical protein HJG60_009353 [Phyllostomus discolor]